VIAWFWRHIELFVAILFVSMAVALILLVVTSHGRRIDRCLAQTCPAPLSPRYDSQAGLCRCEVLPKVSP